MKRLQVISFCILTSVTLHAQDMQPVQLNPHSEVRGLTVMEAFQNRQFIREYEEKDLDLQDLSDLLWGAYGINRENGKRTAPTAQNSQDVDVFVCRADGVYLYDASTNMLQPVIKEDIRSLLEGKRTTGAPICLLLISDMSRYRDYDPESPHLTHYYEMGAVDCGIVSQNISICYAGLGLGTGPRAGMNQEAIRKALSLKDSQHIWLNHPVGYPKTHSDR